MCIIAWHRITFFFFFYNTDTVIVHSLYLHRVLFTFLDWFVDMVCVFFFVFFLGGGGVDYIFGLFFISSAVKHLLFAGPEI